MSQRNFGPDFRHVWCINILKRTVRTKPNIIRSCFKFRTIHSMKWLKQYLVVYAYVNYPKIISMIRIAEKRRGEKRRDERGEIYSRDDRLRERGRKIDRETECRKFETNRANNMRVMNVWNHYSYGDLKLATLSVNCDAVTDNSPCLLCKQKYH